MLLVTPRVVREYSLLEGGPGTTHYLGRGGEGRESKDVFSFFSSLLKQIIGHLLDKTLLHHLKNLAAHKKSFHAAVWLQTVKFLPNNSNKMKVNPQ